MTIEVLKSKIHRVTVTGAELDYVGSITIDEHRRFIFLSLGSPYEVLDQDDFFLVALEGIFTISRTVHLLNSRQQR